MNDDSEIRILPLPEKPTPPTPDEIRQMLTEQVPAGVRTLIDRIGQTAESLDMEIYLVGGFVRDLILRRPSLDLDFTIVGDGHSATAPIVVRALVDKYGGEAAIHPAFLTATWTPGADLRAELDLPLIDGEPLTIDLVTARRETYAYPGALPTVEPGTLEDDLFRRDFTINAMAIKLPDLEWVDPYHGFDDLHVLPHQWGNKNQAAVVTIDPSLWFLVADLTENPPATRHYLIPFHGLLRVLHEHSFIDDPTRITRGVRFQCRYPFSLSDETFQLIEPSLYAIDNVSGERWRAEFSLIFTGAGFNPALCLLFLGSDNVLERLAPGISIAEEGTYGFLLEHLHRLQKCQFDDKSEALVLNDAAWILFVNASTERPSLIARLKLPPSILASVKAIDRIMSFLVEQPDSKPSTFVRMIEPIDLPACAALWAIVLPDQRPLIERYVQTWRTLQPITTGDDLKARGLQPGPVFRKILGELRDGWIDGVITSKADEDRLLDRLIADLTPSSDNP